MKKIVIGISTIGNINTAFIKNLEERRIEWASNLKDRFDVKIIYNDAPFLDVSRNEIVVEAIQVHHADYILFLDNDIKIRAMDLERLLAWCINSKGLIKVICGVYMRKRPPYLPIMMKQISDCTFNPIVDYMDNKYTLANNPDLIEIDGTGLGCMLVNTDIFKYTDTFKGNDENNENKNTNKISYPFFKNQWIEPVKESGRWNLLEGDLYFCMQIRKAGYNIYCDKKVELPHFGTDIVPADYLESGKKLEDIITAYHDMDKLIEELAEFKNISIGDAWKNALCGTELAIKDWYKYGCDPDRFYKESSDYIYDLVGWHVGQRLKFDYNIVNHIKEIEKKAGHKLKILDFGSGIGQNAIMLHEAGFDISMMDINGQLNDFAQFRLNKRGHDLLFYDINKKDDFYLKNTEKFDLILCFDVIEHIPDNKFKETIDLIKSLKKDGGYVLYTISWGDDGGHPMHYNWSQEKEKLLEELK